MSLIGFTLAWSLWVQSRVQHHVLRFLVLRAGGSPRRGAAATALLQGVAAAVAVAAIAAAVYAELVFNAVYVRAPLMIGVLLGYVPLAATLGRTKLRKIRKPVQQRLHELGAPAEVAEAIARAGRPWSLFGSLVMLAAVLVLSWHHLR